MGDDLKLHGDFSAHELQLIQKEMPGATVKQVDNKGRKYAKIDLQLEGGESAKLKTSIHAGVTQERALINTLTKTNEIALKKLKYDEGGGKVFGAESAERKEIAARAELIKKLKANLITTKVKERMKFSKDVAVEFTKDLGRTVAASTMGLASVWVAKKTASVAKSAFKAIANTWVGKEISSTAKHFAKDIKNIHSEARQGINHMHSAIGNKNGPSLEKLYNKMTQKNNHADEFSIKDQAKFEEKLTKDSSILTKAIKKGKWEDVHFLLDKGLFKVDKHVLNALHHVPYLSETEKQEILGKMFLHCKYPESLSRMTDYLTARDPDGAAQAKELVREGLEKFKGVDKERYERCQMLAPQFGDEVLFEKAFGVKLDDIMPVTADGVAKQDPSDRAKVRDAFLKNNFSLINSTSKHGQNILHRSCMGNNARMTQFLSEVMYENNKRNIDMADEFLGAMKRGGIRAALTTIKGSDDERIAQMKAMSNMGLVGKGKGGTGVGRYLTSHFPRIFKSDPKLGEMVNYLDSVKTKNFDAMDIKIIANLEDRLRASRNEINKSKNPFLMRDHDGTRPRHVMGMKLANGMDRLNGLKGNEVGSFSNAVSYRQMVYAKRSPWEKAAMFGGAVGGKYLSAVASMKAVEAAHGVVTTFAAQNIPMFAMAGLATYGVYKGQHAYRKSRAHNLAIDKTLNQYESFMEGNLHKVKSRFDEKYYGKKDSIKDPSEKMKFCITNRDLDSILDLIKLDKNQEIKVTQKMILSFRKMPYFLDSHGVDRKAEILQALTERTAKEEFGPKTEAAGAFATRRIEKQVFKLLNDQLNNEDPEVVKSTIQGMSKSFQTAWDAYTPKIQARHKELLESTNPLTQSQKEELTNYNSLKANLDRRTSQMKGCLLVASKMGDVSVLKEAIATADATLGKQDPLYLLKIKHTKTDDTLLHMAAKSKDVETTTFLAEKMMEASKGAKVKYETPELWHEHMTMGIRKGIHAVTVGAYHKMIGKEDIGPGEVSHNIFEMTNGKGQKFVDLIDRNMANQMDEAYEFDAKKPGSFTMLVTMREGKHSAQLAMEAGAVLPAKALINLKAAAAVGHIIHVAVSACAHDPSGVSGYLAGSAAEFALGAGVMMAGTMCGLVGGNLGGRFFNNLYNAARGYDNELTQFSFEGLPPEVLQAQTKHAARHARSMKEYSKTLTPDSAEHIKKSYISTLDTILEQSTLNDAEKNQLTALKDNLGKVFVAGKPMYKAQRELVGLMGPLSDQLKTGVHLQFVKSLADNVAKQAEITLKKGAAKGLPEDAAKHAKQMAEQVVNLAAA